MPCRPTLWVAFCAAVAIRANAEIPVSRDFAIRRWTVDEGLPQNRISALAQTPDGYLWLGTWFGVVRFDGMQFTVFNQYNTSALANDAVNALATTPDGSLWIGTNGGLVRYQNGEWTRFTAENGFPEHPIWEMIVDSKSTLWIRNEGVGAFPNGPFAHLQEGGPPHALMVLPNGDAAVATTNGPCILPGAREPARPFDGPRAISREEHSPHWVDDWTVHTVVGDGEGWLLCASSTRIWGILYDMKSGNAGTYWCLWESIETGVGPDFLYRQKNGTVWAAIRNGGLLRINEGSFEPVALVEGKQQPKSSALLDDREGNLWVATDAGLFQLRKRVIKTITQGDGLASDETWSVSEGPNKTIYVATHGGISCIGRWRVLPPPALPPSSGNLCVLGQPDGTLWTDLFSGTKRILFERHPDSTFGVLFEDESLQALYLDREKRLWAGTNRRVRCFQEGRELDLPELPSVEIRFSLQARDGTMWFGSKGNGLFHWQNGVLRQFTKSDGLADDFVIALHEDSDGVLWIGTANGLNRFIPGDGRLFTFRTEHGLFDNQINHILEDDNGFFWFSCNRGIFRIARTELNAVAEGRKSEAVCAVFGTADGMVSSETNGEHQPAGCKANDGRLWFPTMVGVVVVDPKTISTNEVPPGVVIEQVKADHEVVYPQRGQGALRLGPGRGRVVEIQFTANTFVAPEKVRFKYKLEKHDADWRTVGSTERVAYYTDLQPADYSFRVKACNSHGVWNESGASFSFSLAPKFTQRRWFPGLCALGLIACSGAFGFWRLRWQRRVLLAEQRANIERERARIARDLHDDLGTALTGLALEADVARRGRNGSTEALERISNGNRALADRMREVVWAINPRCDSVESLADFFQQYADEFARAAGLRCRFVVPVEMEKVSLGAEARHQLFSAFKEALHNVVKHAHATEVEVGIGVREGMVHLKIADDGVGLREGTSGRGNGLRNIRERIAAAGGEAKIEKRPGGGTTVLMEVPLEGSEGSDRFESAKW